MQSKTVIMYAMESQGSKIAKEGRETDEITRLRVVYRVTRESQRSLVGHLRVKK